MEFTFVFCFMGTFVILAMLFLASAIRIVREDTRLTVYRLGRNIGDKGPGIILLIPLIDKGELKQLGSIEKTPSTRLVGVLGETRSTVYTSGKVFLAGEAWDATSYHPIPAGQRVRVVRMILEVEKA